MKDRKTAICLMLCLCMTVAFTHILAWLPAEVTAAMAFEKVVGGEEWVLEESGIWLTLNRQGIFWGQGEEKQKLTDLSLWQSLVPDRIPTNAEEVFDWTWQKKGFVYAEKDGKKQKYFLLESMSEPDGALLRCFLELGGSLKRIELEKGDLKLGFWITVKSENEQIFP